MRRIWVYQGEFGPGKDFKWMSVAEFERTFSVGQALGFLGQIETTLQEEGLDLTQGSYFYTGLRHVFAEIDGLGKLYAGERGTRNTVENAIRFAKDYLGRLDSRYRSLYGLLVDMYRHGLAHTHLTKSFRFRDPANRWITVGWAMTDEASHRDQHLTIEDGTVRFYRLWLHIPRLIEDTLAAIREYGLDLRKAGAASLFKRFKQGYVGTAAVFQEPPPPSPVKRPSRQPRRTPSLNLKPYSADGLAWIRTEISLGNAWKK